MQQTQSHNHSFAIALFVMLGVVLFTIFGYFFLLPDIAPKRIVVAVIPFESDDSSYETIAVELAGQIASGIALSREVVVVDFDAAIAVTELSGQSRGLVNELGVTHIVDGTLEYAESAWNAEIRVIDISQPAPKLKFKQGYYDLHLREIRDQVTQAVRRSLYDRGSAIGASGPVIEDIPLLSFLRAMAAHRSGDIEQALIELKQSNRLGRNVYADTLLAEIALAKNEGVPPRISESDRYLPAMIVNARIDFATNKNILDYHESLVMLAGNYPNSQAVHLLGQLYLGLGYYQGARVLFERMVRVHPRSSSAAVWVARARYLSGDIVGAREALKIAALRDPNSTQVSQINALQNIQTYQPATCDQRLELALHQNKIQEAVRLIDCVHASWLYPPMWMQSSDIRWRSFSLTEEYVTHRTLIGFSPDAADQLRFADAEQLLAPRRD
ncbi:MAG: hypothetical protein CMD77_01790 [Gammaproteobacteria bacterium]|nr:hypothetical protein [Gammaproteobacteria bacterium]